VTEKAIKKRVGWMQKFFDELQRDKVLKSSDIFIAFFSIPDKPTFEKKKKEICKRQGPKTILDIPHFEGKANVAISSGKVNLAHNIANYVPNCQTLYDKLIKANEDTVKAMRLLAESYIREAEICKELSLSHATIQVIFY